LFALIRVCLRCTTDCTVAASAASNRLGLRIPGSLGVGGVAGEDPKDTPDENQSASTELMRGWGRTPQAIPRLRPTHQQRGCSFKCHLR